MPPPMSPAIITGDGLPALGAGRGARPRLSGDGHPRLLHIQLHVGHGLRGLQPQQSLIEFNVAHRSGPPFENLSIAQEGSITHMIS